MGIFHLVVMYNAFMETRLQTINNDTVMEVTKTVTQKTRHSEADLLHQKAYFEGMITQGQAGLDRVIALLTQINNEKQRVQ